MDRKYTFIPPASRTVWLETAALTAAALGAGFLLHRADPFFLHGRFPWLVFLPMAAGMRYGTLSAAGATVASVAAYYLSSAAGWTQAQTNSVNVFVGMGIASIVAGEFRDLWVRKILSAQAINVTMETRLEEFSRAYALLRISHNAMETRLSAGQHSLRQLLMDARRTMSMHCREDIAFGGNAPKLAELFLSAADIQSLAMLEVRDGKINLPPDYTYGDVPQVSEKALFMLQNAADKRQVATLREGDSETESQDEPLAVIPFTDIGGRVHGLMAIYTMRFAAFNEKTLETLSVIAGHIGDMLAASGGGRRSCEDPSESFLRALERAILNKRNSLLPSALVLYLFTGEKAAQAQELVLATKRGLDREYQPREGALFVLMPLTDRPGIDGYLTRMQSLFREKLGAPPQKLGVGITAHDITADDNSRQLLEGLLEGK